MRLCTFHLIPCFPNPVFHYSDNCLFVAAHTLGNYRYRAILYQKHCYSFKQQRLTAVLPFKRRIHLLNSATWTLYFRTPTISEFGYESDLEFCCELAEKVGVGAVPGSSFFRENVNHLIRLHFAKKDETLNEALNRLGEIRKKL